MLNQGELNRLDSVAINVTADCGLKPENE